MPEKSLGQPKDDAGECVVGGLPFDADVHDRGEGPVPTLAAFDHPERWEGSGT